MKKLLIPLLIGLGILATFLKEVLIAYYFGTSEKVDIFKTASYLPYSFFQTLGTVFVGLYLPKVIDDRNNSEVITSQITKFSILITAAGVLLAPFYIELLAPNFNGQKKDSLVIATIICWLGFFFYSFYFHYRIKLQAYERNALIASTSLINSTTFILILLLVRFIYEGEINYELEVSFFLAAIFLIISYIFLGRKTLKFSSIIANTLKKPENTIPLHLLITAIAVHITAVIPRIIDRAFLSGGPQGFISSLDYAFNIQTAFLLMVGTTISIIFATRIAREIKSKKKGKKTIKLALLVSFTTSIIISLVAFYLSEQIIKLAYLRGAFSVESTTITTNFLRSILPSLPLMTVNIILLQVLLGTHLAKNIIIPNILKLLVKIVTIIFLIKNYGNEHLPIIIGVSLFFSELAFLISGIQRFRSFQREQE